MTAPVRLRRLLKGSLDAVRASSPKAARGPTSDRSVPPPGIFSPTLRNLLLPLAFPWLWDGKQDHPPSSLSPSSGYPGIAMWFRGRGRGESFLSALLASPVRPREWGPSGRIPGAVARTLRTRCGGCGDSPGAEGLGASPFAAPHSPPRFPCSEVCEASHPPRALGPPAAPPRSQPPSTAVSRPQPPPSSGAASLAH